MYQWKKEKWINTQQAYLCRISINLNSVAFWKQNFLKKKRSSCCSLGRMNVWPLHSRLSVSQSLPSVVLKGFINCILHIYIHTFKYLHTYIHIFSFLDSPTQLPLPTCKHKWTHQILYMSVCQLVSLRVEHVKRDGDITFQSTILCFNLCTPRVWE
jgi:hypothetical protein